jgi:hypothetical protein
MSIIQTSIHIIDRDSERVTPRDAPEAFEAYVGELINHVRNNASVRDYKTRSTSTEVITCILNLCANQESEIIYANMNTMANRLLLKETEIQGRVGGMNVEVQRGSLIQALLLDENTGAYSYLLAKVEHSGWVDDSDFTFKTGFSADKKTMWKSCLFDLSDLAANEFYAKVYSDNKAQYWSNGFLELDVMNSDEVNTQKAFQAIDATLGHGFRGITSPDHTIIRNGFVSYLKNNEHIDFPVMVNSILENYQPVDINLTAEESQVATDRIQNIRARLLEQPEKRKFDSQFNAVNSAINARIQQVYKIRDGVDLRVRCAIEDGIIQAIEEGGARYIRIRTDNEVTFRKFQTATQSNQ